MPMNPMRSMTLHRHTAGFTLVEAVIAIVLTGIVSAVVSVFIVMPVRSYVDSVRRAEMTDAADTAVRRIARDVRTALPNSLRQSSTNTNQCIEILPIVGGGRYRNAPTGNVFDFTTAGSFSFDVLADFGVGSLPTGTNHVVVNNLGFSGADAYNSADGVRRQISSVTGSAPTMTVALAAGAKFPYESPGKRFHVVPNNAVMYSCVNSKIIRSTPAIAATATACPAAESAGVTLVDNVDCLNTSFSYTQGVLQRNGLLGIVIKLTRSGESVQLFNEVHVNNVP